MPKAQEHRVILDALPNLNPIRADMAKAPENSDHTSKQRRIQSVKSDYCKHKTLSDALLPLVGNPREPMPEGLLFHLKDYLDLVLPSTQE